MCTLISRCSAIVAAFFTLLHGALAGTDIWFNPLVQSAAVAPPNHVNELNSPWQTPPGLSQVNLLSMQEVEADADQSIVRVPAGRSSSMIDMIAYDNTGNYLFLPHETPFGAGVSRHDIRSRITEVLFQGDQNGANGDWSNDYGAFDPCRFTPNETLFLGEEWTAEGRIIEVMNPFADPADIQIPRIAKVIANVCTRGNKLQ